MVVRIIRNGRPVCGGRLHTAEICDAKMRPGKGLNQSERDRGGSRYRVRQSGKHRFGRSLTLPAGFIQRAKTRRDDG
jgi:hypothetical protein